MRECLQSAPLRACTNDIPRPLIEAEYFYYFARQKHLELSAAELWFTNKLLKLYRRRHDEDTILALQNIMIMMAHVQLACVES